MGDAQAAQSCKAHAQLRPRRPRSKTGCLCCRLRKKKCDENRPRCSGCIKLDLICTWPDAKEFAWRIRLGLSTTTTSNSGDSVNKSSPERSLRVNPGARKASSKPRISNPSQIDNGISGSAVMSVLSESPSDHTSVNAQSPLPFLFPGTYIPGPLYFPQPVSPASKLIQLYCERFCPIILILPAHCPNPFQSIVIPRAFSDTLIMNAISAVGGACGVVGDVETEAAALEKYGHAVRELKPALTAWVPNSSRDTIRLFLATILMCEYEIFCGNQHGMLFHHLRAARYFAQAILEICEEGDPATDPDDLSLCKTLLSIYAMSELYSSLRLPSPMDDFQVTCQSRVLQLQNIQHFDVFPSVFGEASDLLQLIPSICELSVQRRIEVTKGINMNGRKNYDALNCRIEQWCGSIQALSVEVDPSLAIADPSICAVFVIRIAVILFLNASYYCDDIEHVRMISQPLVEQGIHFMALCNGTAWEYLSYWSSIIISSFATTSQQRTSIRKFLSSSDYRLAVRAEQVLSWVWEEHDDVFGIQGLASVLEKHHTSWCCC